MTLPWPSSSANPLVYGSAVASWLNQVVGWDPGYGLEQDPEYYEKFLRDDVIAAACDKLQKLVVGHERSHQARGDEPQHRLLAKSLDELMEETEGFSQSLYNLAAASWKGATWAEIVLAKRILRIGDGLPRVWTVIAEARDVDKRRFRLTRVDASPQTTALAPTDRRPLQGGPLRNRWHWEFNRGFGSTNSSSSWYVPLADVAPNDRWCLHRVDTSERGLGYGYGLAEDLYFGVYAKGAVLRNLLQGIDRWGQGFLVQKVPGLRMGSSSGLTPEQKIASVVATLRKYRTMNVYAMDKDDELDLIDGPAESVDACMGVINYFDDCHSMRILSSTRTSGGSAKEGAFAQAKVEEGSEDANVSFLRTPLEERWSLTAARLLVNANKHNFAALRTPYVTGGITDFYAIPKLKIRGRKMADPEKATVALEMAAKLGLPLKRRQVYDLLELDEPNPEDDPREVLNPAQTQALIEQRPEVSAGLGQARDKVATATSGERKAIGTGGGSVSQDKGERRALALRG